MYQFSIKTAEKIINIETLHVLPYALCRKFITEGAPDICIRSTQEDIDHLRAEFASEKKNLPLWDGNIEVMVVFRKVIEALLEYDTIVLHGATIALNGKAYIFTAQSGVGKTTHIRKWLRNLPEASVVNGDKPFILMKDVPMACGSPWAGKEGMSEDVIVPIKAIVLLERSEDNQIRQITMSEAFPALLQQIYRPSDIEKMRKTIRLLKSLDGKVDFYHFRLNNFKEDCFTVAYNGLIGKNGDSHERVLFT